MRTRMNMRRACLAALAGAAGGLAGSLVMRLGQAGLEGRGGVQKQRSPQGMREQNSGGDQEGSAKEQKQERDPTVKVVTPLSQKLLHREPGPGEKAAGGSFVHYAFGSGTGAVYGVVSELFPAATAGSGAVFGAAVWPR